MIVYIGTACEQEPTIGIVVDNALNVFQKLRDFLDFVDKHTFRVLMKKGHRVVLCKLSHVNILHTVSGNIREEVFQKCALT